MNTGTRGLLSTTVLSGRADRAPAAQPERLRSGNVEGVIHQPRCARKPLHPSLRLDLLHKTVSLTTPRTAGIASVCKGAEGGNANMVQAGRAGHHFPEEG